jgi:hypothetical protein
MIWLPNSENYSRIADWVELYVIKENKAISKQKIQSLFEEGGVEVEDRMADVMNELERRLGLYGQDAPYKINGLRIEPTIKWTNHPIHTLCLIFSTYGVESDTKKGTILFEKIGAKLLKEFFNCESAHLGFPTNSSLKKQLDNVALTSSEIRGAFNPGSKEKDSGVDIILWKSLKDLRSSQVIILVQCGAGADWKEKRPISLNMWNHYINWNYETTVPSMVMTEIVENDKWLKYSKYYGVLIDRARLFRIYNSNLSNIPKPFINEIREWCKTIFN